jgi:hypothetical protein
MSTPYDQDKLNNYWDKVDNKIKAEWYKNGWQGPGTDQGRDIVYKCGCVYWAGWGIPEEKEKSCHSCKYK